MDSTLHPKPYGIFFTMVHNFDTDIACAVGVAEAVVFQNISYWINKNEANHKHFYDGKYWTYNSVAAFATLFPYLSNPQIRRILDKLIEQKYLITGNYNASKYDRTRWFAFGEVGMKFSILGDYVFNESDNPTSENDQIHLPNSANEFDQIGKPIPYINTNKKQSNKGIVNSDELTTDTAPQPFSLETQKEEEDNTPFRTTKPKKPDKRLTIENENSNLKRDYETMISQMDSADKKTCWDTLTTFISEKKPEFIEPYIDLWNLFAITYGLIERRISITNFRRDKIRTRVKEASFDFVEVIKAIRKSAFLKGDNDRGWKVTFDFVIESEKNYIKILEGVLK